MTGKSDRKGNAVIYLALATPVALAVFAVANTLLIRHRHAALQPTATNVPPIRESVPPNPNTLIKPQNVKYVG